MQATIFSATADHEKRALKCCVVCAIYLRTAGSSRTAIIAEASSAGSLAYTRTPFFPGRIISGMAKAERPITGTPCANASIRAMPNASKVDYLIGRGKETRSTPFSKAASMTFWVPMMLV